MPRAITKSPLVTSRTRGKQRFIREVIIFVSHLVNDCGKTTNKKVWDWNTVLTQTLEDFHGFTFTYVSGISQWGNSEITISFQDERGEATVLEVGWYDIGQRKTTLFSADPIWQEKLRSLIEKGWEKAAEELAA